MSKKIPSMNHRASKTRKLINHRKVAVIIPMRGREADTKRRVEKRGKRREETKWPSMMPPSRAAKIGRFPTTFPNLCFADLLLMLARLDLVYKTRKDRRSYRFCHLS